MNYDETPTVWQNLLNHLTVDFNNLVMPFNIKDFKISVESEQVKAKLSFTTQDKTLIQIFTSLLTASPSRDVYPGPIEINTQYHSFTLKEIIPMDRQISPNGVEFSLICDIVGIRNKLK